MIQARFRILFLLLLSTSAIETRADVTNENYPEDMYIWLTPRRYRYLLDYASAHEGDFPKGIRGMVFGFHTPLGSLANNEIGETEISYGTILVKIKLKKPARILEGHSLKHGSNQVQPGD